MGLARNIQLRMLPRASAELGPFDLYARLRSAKEVGGDLYDYQWRQGRLRFCIGDVSGKGVPAALVMALAKTLFRAAGGFEEDPARLMAAVNDHLCEVTGSGIFVTAFCGWFDPADGRLVYCNAGHEPPLLLDGGEARFLPARPGLALGILPEYPYQDQETVLREGEAILLYTDGVTEAENAAREQYTPERLRSELSFRAGWTTLEVVRHLQASVDRFAAGAAQADEITALCLRRTLA
jgi:sigma-B regulation protein RsbU (phosphoserine phosphatase)